MADNQNARQAASQQMMMISDDLKRMSFSMNARQVLPIAGKLGGVKPELLCALC